MRETSDAGRTSATTTPAARFLEAEQRLLRRWRVAAEPRWVPVRSTGGRARVVVAGEGPPLPLVIGGAIPAAFWVPLMAQLPGHRLYAVELPGFGLTDPVRYDHRTLRRTAVAYLADVLDGLGLGPCPFVTQSMGSQWTTWLAAEHPDRVQGQVMVGCPAFFLDTTAILPFRLASVPGMGRLMAAQRPSTSGAERVMRMVGEDPAGLEEVRDVLVAAQALPAYAESLTGLMRAVMSWTRPRSVARVTAAELQRVRHPTRLVWGERDPFGSPAAGRRIAALLPDATLHLVPGGHAPWLHGAPEVGALVRDFLARTDDQGGGS